jgi:hypothetical protein
LTSIGSREYPFLVTSGADSELSGKEAGAPKKRKLLSLNGHLLWMNVFGGILLLGQNVGHFLKFSSNKNYKNKQRHKI